MIMLDHELVLSDMIVDVEYIEVDLYISARLQISERAIIDIINHYQYLTDFENDDVINMSLNKIDVVDFKSEQLIEHECDKFEIDIIFFDSEINSAHRVIINQH